MNRERIRKTLLFLISPQWYRLYKARIDEVSLTRKQEISAIVERQRSKYLLTVFGFWILFSIATGLFSLIKNNLFGAWAAPTVVLLVLLFFVIIATYRGLLNFWAIKNLSVPDHAKITTTDKPLSVYDLPEPDGDSFALGRNAREVVMYSLSKPGYGGHIAIAGRHQFREGLHNAIIYGIMSMPNAVAQVYDMFGGMDFGFLRYEPVQRRRIEALNLSHAETIGKLAQIPLLKRVVVRGEKNNGIQESLHWLAAEVGRRSRIKELVPKATFPVLLIVLDEDLSLAFAGEGKSKSCSYQIDILHQIASKGKNLSVHLLAILPIEVDWGGLDKHFGQDFDCLEVHHTRLVGKEQAPGKNVVVAHDLVAQFYHDGVPHILKVPKVSGDELADRIDEKSDFMSEETNALWQACLTNTKYRDPERDKRLKEVFAMSFDYEKDI